MNRITSAMQVVRFQRENGQIPFDEWIDAPINVRLKAIVLVRLERLAKGLLGDMKLIGEGVNEARIDFGPGYRIYFGIDGRGKMVVLLLGGDKSSQKADIRRATQYWQEYRRLREADG